MSSNKIKSSLKGTRFSRKAIRGMAVFVILLSLLLSISFFKIQVVEHSEMSEAAAGQYYRNTFVAPARGDIYDRNGVKLAGTSYVYRVGITPKHVYSRAKSKSVDEIVAELAKQLNLDEAKIREELKKVDATYIQLAKDIPEENGKALENFVDSNQIGGIRLDAEPRRYYLNGNLASQVIGFASYNDKTLEGRLGLELAYNSILTGEPGFSYAARDNYLSHGLLPYSRSVSKEGYNGANLYVTLDMEIQKIMQEDLEAAIKAYDAVEYGMSICINPYTAEIYGMASYPYFRSDDPTGPPSGVDPKDWDPSNQEKIDWLQQNVWRNKNVSDIYEAGSTMKTVTAAIGLEEGVTTEKTPYSDDPIKVLDAEISCVTITGHGIESMEEGFWRSCNPVFVQIALAVGIDTFYDYMKAFGFYESTGIELPGEASCMFHTKPSLLDLANLSFGESSSVTPLHLIRAFCALVNGGKLVTPHVIKEVRTQDGRLLEAPGPNVERQVISSETSARVRNLMRGMVNNSKGYTNTWGYEIGGKTSTSVDELTGQNTISFVAAGPIDHPEVILLTILQKPKSEKVGGTEAQIVTQNTISKILDYLNVDRTYNNDDVYKMGKSIRVPNFYGYKVHDAAEQMTYYHVQVVAGDEQTQADSTVKSQLPPPNTLIYPGTNIYVYKGDAPKEEAVIPDFTEMNYNEVINTCNEIGIVPQFEGNLMGNCIHQKVADDSTLPPGSTGKAGEKIYRGSVIQIALAFHSSANP